MRYDERLSAALAAMPPERLAALEGEAVSVYTTTCGGECPPELVPPGTVAGRVSGRWGFSVYFLRPEIAARLSYEGAEATAMTIKQTRAYRDDEIPRIGDVVRVYDGSFGDAVVDGSPSLGLLTLRRPHIMLDGMRWRLLDEIVTVPQERVRAMPVYVTGPTGHIENRAGLSGSGPDRGDPPWIRTG